MSLVLDRTSLRDIARNQLIAEFHESAMEGPEATTLTPAWGNSRASIWELVNDNFSGTGGDAAGKEALRILRNAAQGVDVRLQALAWWASEEKRFADTHESDRVIELLGEEER